MWLDFLRRGLITGGGLQKLIDEDGLSGVTSNPSIFRKAISGSTDYDEPVRALVERGVTDTRTIFYDLALEDIQMAADLFRPQFDETSGARGFVSFELEAAIAHDTKASVEKAKELFARIDRPNAMIKVPGTPEGVPAVEELTAAGVNVNITLLFSVERYEEVARAYIAGLEKRLASGHTDLPASVASFFVSRVDSSVDEKLPEDSPLRGQIAIANAKKAYQRFLEIFTGERWEALAARGALVQQPLWASTSTKNPAYRDVMYIEELVGADTVNTMPEATINAFRDHGVVRPSAVTEHVEGALAMLDELPSLGIDLDAITAELLEKGLDAFDEDFAALLATIGEKAGGKKETAPRAHLGSLDKAVDARMASMGKKNVVPRMWRKEHTVWKPHPTEISDRLGWLGVMDTMLEQVGELESFAKKAASDGLRTAVLCGMGGSSLAPEVFARTYGAADGALELVVLDTTHPAAIARVTDELPPDETMYIVASKSGTTLETNSHLEHFWARTSDGGHFVAITDPGTPLEKLARERSFRRVFLNPPDIGGRYSALSLFGLVPAALLGAPLFELLDAAQEMACACDPAVPVEQNPGAFLGAAIGEAARAGRDKLTFVLPKAIASFGDWVEQLIAESTGKEGRGIVPIVGEEFGVPEAYKDDRIFVTYGDLSVGEQPVVPLPDRGAEHLGAEFFRWEFATAIAGYILGINPFDQPNVASAKEATAEILAAGAPESPGLDDVEALLAQVKSGDYIALQAFVDPTDEARDDLQRARLALRDRFAAATTAGFGPRYLHSTGQLHKGGANNGVFIQIVDEERKNDVPIPGKPFSFGALIDAQALGDLRSLRAAGRRVARTTMSRLKRVIG
jgi:transaldolase/glucose-6-phosphate isomerase